MSNTLPSKLDTKATRYEKNREALLALLGALRKEQETIRLGGGTKAIDAQHAKKRLTARERLALLLDPGAAFLELGLYTAYQMYEEWGGAPAAGVVTGLGRVHGRLMMVIANGATGEAGAFFPANATMRIRAL